MTQDNAVEVVLTLDLEEAILLESALSITLLTLSNEETVTALLGLDLSDGGYDRRVMMTSVATLIGRPDGLLGALDRIARVAKKVLAQVEQDKFDDYHAKAMKAALGESD